MKEIGMVSEIQGKKAQVVIQRNAACGDCGACQVGKDRLTMKAYAVNTIGAKKGDQVEVEMEFVNVLKASFILYGLPLIVFMIGIFIGSYTPLIGSNSPLSSFLLGMVLMSITFIIIKTFDRKGIFSLKYEPHITYIVNPKNS